jgi:hypothetical protein
MSQTRGINTLKQLLFEEENQKYRELSQRIGALQEKMDQNLEAQKLPHGELNQLVEQIAEIMPERMGPTITKTLRNQIRESRDEMVQTLYPIIGQMVKKYIQREIQVLSDRIDRQLDNAFSFDNMLDRIRAYLFGVKQSELILKALKKTRVEEIFIIEEQSGILMASYSRGKTLDQDMIAGMLTAIRSFVEDAFQKPDQKLESIAYDEYKIYVQGFERFYIAVVLSGVLDAAFKNRLDDAIMKFVKDVSMKAIPEDNKEYVYKMVEYFGKL